MKVDGLDSLVVHLARPAAHPKLRVTPERTCVGCRKQCEAAELLRVVAVDGRLVVDERRRLPGRGAWLHPGQGCLTKAERRRAFPRALKVTGALDASGVRDHFARFGSVSADEGQPRVHQESRKQVDPS